MKIGDLSTKTGCKPVTIRYYEQQGLLRKPERNIGNYRLYTTEDLKRLEFILHCRKHDMKLEEIKKLLSFQAHPQTDCTWITSLINEHIQNVEEQIASLEHLKLHLKQLKQRCAGGQDGENCGILESLKDKKLCCEENMLDHP